MIRFSNQYVWPCPLVTFHPLQRMAHWCNILISSHYQKYGTGGIQCGFHLGLSHFTRKLFHDLISSPWYLEVEWWWIADLVEFGCLRRTQKLYANMIDQNKHQPFRGLFGCGWCNWRLRSQVLTNINYLRGKELKTTNWMYDIWYVIGMRPSIVHRWRAIEFRGCGCLTIYQVVYEHPINNNCRKPVA